MSELVRQREDESVVGSAVFILVIVAGVAGFGLGTEYELRRVRHYLDVHAGESGYALAAGVHAERHRDGPSLLLAAGVDPADVGGVCATCGRTLVPAERLDGPPWQDDLGDSGCGGSCDPHVRVP